MNNSNNILELETEKELKETQTEDKFRSIGSFSRDAGPTLRVNWGANKTTQRFYPFPPYDLVDLPEK
jgi:hypothetical protein